MATNRQARAYAEEIMRLRKEKVSPRCLGHGAWCEQCRVDVAAAENEVERLRKELADSEEGRKWLEAQVRDLESRLAKAGLDTGHEGGRG